MSKRAAVGSSEAKVLFPLSALLAAASISAVFATACSSPEDPAEGDPSSGGASSTGGSSGSSGTGGISLNGTGGKADGPNCGDTLDLEGCSCAAGAAARSCYPGPAAQAGNGACAMGTQSCEAVKKGEFGSGVWGPCTGAGAPKTCADAGVSCGPASDGCGGQLDCGACSSCVAGTKTFSVPGTFDFDVPAFETLTVRVWGAGGGGKAYGQVEQPSKGGDSSFNGTVVAGGGDSGNTGLGGLATGGTTNTPGGNGAPPCDQGPPVLCTQIPGGGFSGGDSPFGGKGANSVNSVDACAGGDGMNGAAPGGGGAGSYTCQMTWWVGTGWGFSGRGAGAGAYSMLSYAKGQLAKGSKIPVVVGAGGLGSKGAMTSGFPGTGKNPGHYTAGDGGPGQVEITWTCP